MSPSDGDSMALVRGGLVLPAATPEKAKEAIDSFYTLRDYLLDEDDWQVIWVSKKQPDGSYKKEKEKFPKKSGRCKLDLAFNVSQEFVQSERKEIDDKNFGVLVVMKAIAPNGRVAVGDGWCDTIEKAGHKYHDIFTIAKTRASNRASFDLYGLGHVSAEEMTGNPPPAEKPSQTRQATPTEYEVVPDEPTVIKAAFVVKGRCKEQGWDIDDFAQYIVGQGITKSGPNQGKPFDRYKIPVSVWEGTVPFEPTASDVAIEAEDEIPFTHGVGGEIEVADGASIADASDMVEPGSDEMKKLRQSLLIVYDDLAAAGDWLRLKHGIALNIPIARNTYNRVLADVQKLKGVSE